MAYSLLRTASMAISKKQSSKGSKQQVGYGGTGNGGGGRRHTMLTRPQVRDSVLSNGSSDRSSSVSDETAISPPTVSYGNDFFR